VAVLQPSMTTGDGAGYLGGDTVKTTYDLAALMAFRANNIYRAVADVRRDLSGLPMKGNPVTFTIITALAPQTTALTEDTEPTPVKIADTQKTITLAEYGNAAKMSKKVRATSFLSLDLDVPKEMSAHMEESVDILARDVLVAGTNVLYAGAATSRVTVAAGSILTGNNARRARSYLAGKNTPGMANQIGSGYVAYIHPDVSYDLRAESANISAWLAPQVYSGSPDNVLNGEMGMFEGSRFVENANQKNFVDAGVGSTVDVYATTFVGQQALGIAVGETQHMVISGPFDDLQRFVSVGWYALLGFGRIRENSLLRYESSSSIGANT
jgi:N4-gp56 family major capsid protein